MLREVVMSPMGARTGDSLFDQLRNLSSEISEGIIELSNGKRWLVDVELQRLCEQAQKEVSPEASYNTLLFRKYADIANQLKTDNVELKSTQQAFPSLLPEAGNDERLLRGFDALKSNLFWLRVVAALFSFISFVVMSTVPHVSRVQYHPADYFDVSLRGTLQYLHCTTHLECLFTVIVIIDAMLVLQSSCDDVELVGSFDMSPYQLLVVAGVLIYIHTLVTSLYYLLPVDDENQKYIPGKLFTLCALLLVYCIVCSACITYYSVDLPYCTYCMYNAYSMYCRAEEVCGDLSG